MINIKDIKILSLLIMINLNNSVFSDENSEHCNIWLYNKYFKFKTSYNQRIKDLKHNIQVYNIEANNFFNYLEQLNNQTIKNLHNIVETSEINQDMLFPTQYYCKNTDKYMNNILKDKIFTHEANSELIALQKKILEGYTLEVYTNIEKFAFTGLKKQRFLQQTYNFIRSEEQLFAQEIKGINNHLINLKQRLRCLRSIFHRLSNIHITYKEACKAIKEIKKIDLNDKNIINKTLQLIKIIDGYISRLSTIGKNITNDKNIISNNYIKYITEFYSLNLACQILENIDLLICNNYPFIEINDFKNKIVNCVATDNVKEKVNELKVCFKDNQIAIEFGKLLGGAQILRIKICELLEYISETLDWNINNTANDDNSNCEESNNEIENQSNHSNDDKSNCKESNNENREKIQTSFHDENGNYWYRLNDNFYLVYPLLGWYVNDGKNYIFVKIMS